MVGAGTGTKKRKDHTEATEGSGGWDRAEGFITEDTEIGAQRSRRKKEDKDNAEAQKYAEVRRGEEERKEGSFDWGLLKAEGSAQDDSVGVTRMVGVSGGTR